MEIKQESYIMHSNYLYNNCKTEAKHECKSAKRYPFTVKNHHQSNEYMGNIKEHKKLNRYNNTECN